jgi:hypothetical protein
MERMKGNNGFGNGEDGTNPGSDNGRSQVASKQNQGPDNSVPIKFMASDGSFRFDGR